MDKTYNIGRKEHDAIVYLVLLMNRFRMRFTVNQRPVGAWDVFKYVERKAKYAD